MNTRNHGINGTRAFFAWVHSGLDLHSQEAFIL